MKIVFSALHFASFRNFESVVHALAERGHHVHLMADETDVTLVNVNQLDSRELILQGGAYGEHDIVTANEVNTPANSRHVRVQLAPGAGGKLTLRFKRHVNPPTLALPW